MTAVELTEALREAGDGWSHKLDALLLAAYRDAEAKGAISWNAMGRLFSRKGRDCRGRVKALTGKAPAISSAPAAPAKEDRVDGLEWLVKKKRLTDGQMREAWAYRRDFQAAELDGAALKSSLAEPEAIGSGKVPDKLTPVVNRVEAKRRQFIRRFQILAGQSDMLMVLDAVVGKGQTLRELAGGDGHKANTLEAVLKVALDLLVTQAQFVA